jgi:hypothetical protein
MSRHSRRNPGTRTRLLPLILIGVGIAAIAASRPKAGPVNGFGDVIDEYTAAAKAAEAQLVTLRAALVKANALYVDNSRMRRGGAITSAEKAKRVSAIQTQITATETALRQANTAIAAAAARAASQPQVSLPAPAAQQQAPVRTTSIIQPPAPAVQPQSNWQSMVQQVQQAPQTYDQIQQMAPRAPESSSVLPPAADTPAPTTVEEAVPAAAPSGKINPLVTVAAMLSVPVLMMATGGK